METGIHIGSVKDAETVEALGEAIVKVLNCPGDQATLQKALDVLGQMAEVKNVTVSGATIKNREARR